MICPICGNEMESGGLITSTRAGAITWLPGDSFEKNRWPMIASLNGKVIKVQVKFFPGQIKIPNAFYCERCNKVIGFFDIIDTKE